MENEHKSANNIHKNEDNISKEQLTNHELARRFIELMESLSYTFNSLLERFLHPTQL